MAKKTLQEKIESALLEAEGGKLPGADSNTLSSTKPGVDADTKSKDSTVPTATSGDGTPGKLPGAEAPELDGTKPAASTSKAGIPDSKGAGNSEAGFVDFTAPEQLKLKEQIEALLGEELSLSAEFKDKAAGLFEASVIARANQAIMEHKETMQAQFDTELLEAVEDITEQVDSYVTYAVKQWTEENKVSLEKGIRTELAESFISGLHILFKENFITVPEGKEDLVESLTANVADLTEKFNQSVKTAILKESEINELKRTIAFDGLTEGLAASEIDKLKQLVEGIEYDTEEDYSAKINTIRESYFNKSPTKPKVLAEDKKLVGNDPVITEANTSGIAKAVATQIVSMNSFRNK